MRQQLTQRPIMSTGMLIRRPVADVFEAFVDPAVTSNFWFTKGSARLEAGKTVEWTWEMYDVSVPVTVKAIEREQRILIEWPGYGSTTTVQWTFAPFGDDATFVSITESGFVGNGDEILKAVASSSEGFTLVLAGAKAFLEQGVKLNLVADRYPKGLGADS
jgi:uncharacterized protein YndB with AHSA1/START domain